MSSPGAPGAVAAPVGRFALFADCLLAGCLVVVAALPVVTAYPALVAGCAVLRDRVADDTGVGPVAYLRRLRQVAASGIAGFLVPPAVVAVLVLDAVAVAAGVPGAAALRWPLVAGAAAAAVLALRAAGAWRPGCRWPPVARRAAAEVVRDPGGAALLLLAAGTAAVVAVAVPVTALLLPGPVALAAVAVDARRPAGPDV
jgi:hypothetical protein